MNTGWAKQFGAAAIAAFVAVGCSGGPMSSSGPSHMVMAEGVSSNGNGATSATKAYLAECILNAAAQGQTSYDGLVAAAADQIQAVLSLFT